MSDTNKRQLIIGAETIDIDCTKINVHFNGTRAKVSIEFPYECVNMALTTKLMASTGFSIVFNSVNTMDFTDLIEAEMHISDEGELKGILSINCLPVTTTA